MTHARARRAGYEWPKVSLVHPDHGAYQFAVHGVRAADGTITLMAFHGGPAADAKKMNDVVFTVARRDRSRVIKLDEAEISSDLGIFLAAKAHDAPGTGVLVLPGSEWGISDRGDGPGTQAAA